MKRIICIALSLLLCLCFTSCKDNNDDNNISLLPNSSQTESSNIESSQTGESFPLPAKNIVSYQNNSVILCFGDSLTQGFGSSGGSFDYPTQLNSNLGGQYKVVNAGSSGEHSLAVLTRALIRKIYLSQDIVFEKGEASVKVSDTFLYCKDALDKLFYDGMGAELKITDLIIDGQKYRLTRTSDEKTPFTITRENTDSAMTLSKDTEAKFDFSAYYGSVYCSVVLMGNNHGRTVTADELFAYYKEFADANPKSILIIPYWRDDLTERMQKEFGERALEVKSYFMEDAFSDYHLSPTVLDNWCVEKGKVPACFKMENKHTDVHLNDAGYKILADLVYKKGVSLGYWQ